MAFDIAPQHRIAPNCHVCPVQNCASRCPDKAVTWRAAVSLLPPQIPGCGNLVNAGMPVPGLFTVRAGCIKSYTLDSLGNEHVRAFHFPGDIVGLDALGDEQSASAASAVSPSQVCAISLNDLGHQMEVDPFMSTHLLKKTREALRRAMALSGEFSADQRVAAFLLFVHSRIGSGDVVRLPMTRREMGSYLRLATETVCRVLARFEKNGWVACSDKRITLMNRPSLTKLAEPVAL
ncbi:transcriptional regulator [Panacagrimonas perspica]|uniref:Transcriptional regulator n=1 Tax=Panacagrimonas perspica TaxID=381431 RepID=A0A4S3K4W1_9GAMM|nr:helix-turn-helix domain-containing protein [Panacagrimonas perspica]TDU31639.1 transcriptional regulator [Panacagrimonas perspica]THD03135.1 hypothetical protein B1810_11155 [Panacagrimonas perspica]